MMHMNISLHIITTRISDENYNMLIVTCTVSCFLAQQEQVIKHWHFFAAFAFHHISVIVGCYSYNIAANNGWLLNTGIYGGKICSLLWKFTEDNLFYHLEFSWQIVKVSAELSVNFHISWQSVLVLSLVSGKHWDITVNSEYAKVLKEEIWCTVLYSEQWLKSAETGW